MAKIMEMKREGNINGLIAVLKSDKDWMLCLDAAEALAQLGDKRGIDYLHKVVENPDPNVRDVAKEILEGLKDYQPDPITQPHSVDSLNGSIKMTTQETPETDKVTKGPSSGKVPISKFDKLISVVLAALVGVAAVAIALLIIAKGLGIGGGGIIYGLILIGVGWASYGFCIKLVKRIVWVRWPVIVLLIIGIAYLSINYKSIGFEDPIVPIILVILPIALLYMFIPDTSKSYIKIRGDTAAGKKTPEIEQILQSPLIQDEHVVRFYQTTLNAWSNGKLSSLDKGYENEGRMQQGDFVKKYPPNEGSALRVFFEKFLPLEGEFLVGLGNLKTTKGLGNLKTTKTSGWFVITNLRLIQRDGSNDQFKEVALAEVDTYQIKGATTKTLVFKMKSGEEITFEKVQMYPTDKFLSEMISQRIVA